MPRNPSAAFHRRRSALAGTLAILLAGIARGTHAQSGAIRPERRWYEAADAARRLAESWGDQPYGAVLVLGGSIIGEGPSRVVRNNDVNAHAEREAIRDARARLGRKDLAGAVLYSTSRPCSLCEAAAAKAGISRMFYGPLLTDAGAPSQARQ